MKRNSLTSDCTAQVRAARALSFSPPAFAALASLEANTLTLLLLSGYSFCLACHIFRPSQGPTSIAATLRFYAVVYRPT